MQFNCTALTHTAQEISQRSRGGEKRISPPVHGRSRPDVTVESWLWGGFEFACRNSHDSAFPFTLFARGLTYLNTFPYRRQYGLHGTARSQASISCPTSTRGALVDLLTAWSACPNAHYCNHLLPESALTVPQRTRKRCVVHTCPNNPTRFSVCELCRNPCTQCLNLLTADRIGNADRRPHARLHQSNILRMSKAGVVPHRRASVVLYSQLYLDVHSRYWLRCATRLDSTRLDLSPDGRAPVPRAWTGAYACDIALAQCVQAWYPGLRGSRI